MGRPLRFAQIASLKAGVFFVMRPKLAFGESTEFAIFPEIRILQMPDPKRADHMKKIGKVDFVLGHVVDGSVVDFCALEVQATYFSGTETRSLLRHFMENRGFGIHSPFRRPDFRSSAQKRLVPQLHLKVPVFRRWGKKFFVVIDSQFFRSLPQIRETTLANSELTWMVYPLSAEGPVFRMRDVQPVFTEWADVETSLREGRAPDPVEILNELQVKFAGKGKGAGKVHRC